MKTDHLDIIKDKNGFITVRNKAGKTFIMPKPPTTKQKIFKGFKTILLFPFLFSAAFGRVFLKELGNWSFFIGFRM